MSKALDRLEHLRIGIQHINQDESPAFISQYEEDIDIIETALKDTEKYKKALEIIKEKQVDVYWLWLSADVEKYNDVMNKKFIDTQKHILTQEEYELIKEILG